MDGGQIARRYPINGTALIQNRERYDANILAAFFNAFIGKLETAEDYLAKARDVVETDYPTIRAIELMIAGARGNNQRVIELKQKFWNSQSTRAWDSLRICSASGTRSKSSR